MRRCPALTVLLIIVTLLLAAGRVRAELPPQLTLPPEILADAFLQGLSARIALTPEEIATIRPILVEQADKRQALVRSRLSGNPGLSEMRALRDDLRAIGQEAEAKLAAVLPPDKLAVLKAYQGERRQELRGHLATARRGG